MEPNDAVTELIKEVRKGLEYTQARAEKARKLSTVCRWFTVAAWSLTITCAIITSRARQHAKDAEMQVNRLIQQQQQSNTSPR